MTSNDVFGKTMFLNKSVSIFVKLVFDVYFACGKTSQIFSEIFFAGQTLANLVKICENRESFSP